MSMIKMRCGMNLSDKTLPLVELFKTDKVQSGNWPLAHGCTMAY